MRLRPIAPDYDPGYPRMIELGDLTLLAATRRAVFGPRTLAFAGLLGTTLLLPAPAPAAPPATEPPAEPAVERTVERIGPPLTATNPKAARIANKALDALRAQSGWSGQSTLESDLYAPGNPPLSVPRIPISFGNSYTGVFDLARARRLTLELFRAYGLDPKADHPFTAEGIAFHADGYDPARGIGFEIIEHGAPPPDAAPAAVLDAAEQSRLRQSVGLREPTLFIAPATSYPKMDGDQFTPTYAYLRSVLAWLDWLKAEGRL